MVYETFDVAQPEVVGEDEYCTCVVVLYLYTVDFCYCVRVPVFTFYLYKKECGRTSARHAFSLTL